MTKSNIEIREQNIKDFFNEIQNYVLGKIPIGDELNLLFNFRSNLRKARLIRFFESFRNELENFHGRPLSVDEISTEEFLDVMENVMNKVQITQSLYKVERFRNILLKQAVKPIENQLAIKYIQVIDELTDIQMIILDTIEEENTSIRDYYHIIKLIWLNYNPNLKLSEYNHQDFTIENYGSELLISSKEVRFYLTDLISKGLVVNKAVDELTIPNMKFNSWPNSSNHEVKVKRVKKELYFISDFTKNMLEFLKTKD